MGFLHYHNRSPLNTVERAIRNAIGLHQLPPEATVRNIHQFKKNIIDLIAIKAIQGREKLVEIYKYIMYDLQAFIYSPSSNSSSIHLDVIQLPNMKTIIQQMQS